MVQWRAKYMLRTPTSRNKIFEIMYLGERFIFYDCWLHDDTKSWGRNECYTTVGHEDNLLKGLSKFENLP